VRAISQFHIMPPILFFVLYLTPEYNNVILRSICLLLYNIVRARLLQYLSFSLSLSIMYKIYCTQLYNNNIINYIVTVILLHNIIWSVITRDRCRCLFNTTNILFGKIRFNVIVETMKRQIIYRRRIVTSTCYTMHTLQKQ